MRIGWTEKLFLGFWYAGLVFVTFHFHGPIAVCNVVSAVWLSYWLGKRVQRVQRDKESERVLARLTGEIEDCLTAIDSAEKIHAENSRQTVSHIRSAFADLRAARRISGPS